MHDPGKGEFVACPIAPDIVLRFYKYRRELVSRHPGDGMRLVRSIASPSAYIPDDEAVVPARPRGFPLVGESGVQFLQKVLLGRSAEGNFVCTRSAAIPVSIIRRNRWQVLKTIFKYRSRFARTVLKYST